MKADVARLARFVGLLCDAIERLQSDGEELGCTCATTEQRNSRHAGNRRRQDSDCTGVAIAVRDRNLVRRARRLIR
jgi:hypothetical protein